MSVVYSAVAGYGVMFTGEEVVDFVKNNNIPTDDYYSWECAEAIRREYKLDFVCAGDSMCGGGEYFLFGAVLQLNSYDDDQFRFNEIFPSPSVAEPLRTLAIDSGKEPAFYAGMHVG